MNKFPQRLKELRLELGLSQNQLSKNLQISQACVSFWESGEQQPSMEFLIMLADYFNCSIDYLVGRVD